jgi:hypothetical protein
MDDAIVVGGIGRLLTGICLTALALALIGLGFSLGWGIGWMAWIPAVALLVPGSACLQRRVLRAEPGGIECLDGWLWRRGMVLPLTGAELEIAPTAGWQAVVLHVGGRPWPLALWVGRRQAEAIAAFCDRCAGAPLPRRQTVLPPADR